MSDSLPGDSRGEGLPGLEGIFRGMGRLLKLADKLKESGEPMQRCGQFSLGGKSGPDRALKGDYNFSVRLGLGGAGSPMETLSRPPADAKKECWQQPGGLKAGVKEQESEEAGIFLDIFEERGAVVLTLEAAGLRPGDLEVKTSGNTLQLRGRVQDKTFSREVSLSFLPRDLTIEHKSGLVIITVPRPAEDADDQ